MPCMGALGGPVRASWGHGGGLACYGAVGCVRGAVGAAEDGVVATVLPVIGRGGVSCLPDR